MAASPSRWKFACPARISSRFDFLIASHGQVDNRRQRFAASLWPSHLAACPRLAMIFASPGLAKSDSEFRIPNSPFETWTPNCSIVPTRSLSASLSFETPFDYETRQQEIVQIEAKMGAPDFWDNQETCLLYTSPSPRDLSTSRMPSSA